MKTLFSFGKKSLAVLLSVMLVFSAAAVSAYAESLPESISVGETKTVLIATEDDMAYYLFAPETDAVLSFYASSGGDDTKGYVYACNEDYTPGNQLAYNDDAIGADFRIDMKFRAGQKYLLAAKYFSSDQTGSFSVLLAECVPETIDAEALVFNQTKSATFESAEHIADYYSFTAAEDGIYQVNLGGYKPSINGYVSFNSHYLVAYYGKSSTEIYPAARLEPVLTDSDFENCSRISVYSLNAGDVVFFKIYNNDYYAEYPLEYTVTVTEYDIKDISVDVPGGITVYQGFDSMETEEGGTVHHYYNPSYIEDSIEAAAEYTVTYSDGSTSVYKTQVIEWDYVPVNEKGEILNINDFDIVAGNDYFDWKPGDYTVTCSVNDLFYSDITVHVVDPDISSIKFNFTDTPVILEHSGGYPISSDMYYYYSPQFLAASDSVTVTYGDGSTKTYTTELDFDNREAYFIDENGEKPPFDIYNFYFDRDSQTNNPYTVGMNTVKLKYGDDEITGVSIEPVEVKIVAPASGKFTPAGEYKVVYAPEVTEYEMPLFNKGDSVILYDADDAEICALTYFPEYTFFVSDNGAFQISASSSYFMPDYLIDMDADQDETPWVKGENTASVFLIHRQDRLNIKLGDVTVNAVDAGEDKMGELQLAVPESFNYYGNPTSYTFTPAKSTSYTFTADGTAVWGEEIGMSVGINLVLTGPDGEEIPVKPGNITNRKTADLEAGVTYKVTCTSERNNYITLEVNYTDYADVLDDLKTEAKKAIDEATPDDASDAVKAIADDAKKAIDDAETAKEIEQIKDKALEDIEAQKDLDNAKTEAKKAIDDATPEGSSDAVKAIADDAKKAIDSAKTAEEVKQIKDKALGDIKKQNDLESAKAEAKKAIDDAVPENASDAVKAIADDAKKKIDNAETAEEIEQIKNKALEDIAAQKKKEKDGENDSNSRPEPLDFTVSKEELERTRLYGMDNGFSVKGDIPKGAKIEWYVNGEKAGEGRNFIVTEPKADYTIQAKIVDAQGNVLSETDEVTIDINTGLLARLYWFVCSLVQRVIDIFKGEGRLSPSPITE